MESGRLSWQELWLVRTLASGGERKLGELLALMPESDARTPRVRAASLSRSLTRLSRRGMVVRVNRHSFAAVGAKSVPVGTPEATPDELRARGRLTKRESAQRTVNKVDFSSGDWRVICAQLKAKE